jgi:hypothetical protein
MDRFEELNELVQKYRTNFRKFYGKGNKAAGVRLRKNMQELRHFGKKIRDEVQELNAVRSNGQEKHVEC